MKIQHYILTRLAINWKCHPVEWFERRFEIFKETCYPLDRYNKNYMWIWGIHNKNKSSRCLGSPYHNKRYIKILKNNFTVDFKKVCKILAKR